jgi:1-deoxy-D-xylulose-5-phosphate synthase
VVNARFAKPLDAERIVALARRTGHVVTAEEAAGQGGFGSAVLEALAAADVVAHARCLALPDRLVEHGNSDQQKEEAGLSPAGIAAAVRALVGGRAGHDGSER